MSVPWSERQLRIAEIKRLQSQPKEKPRLALRVARYFIGDDYDEEVLPAGLINTIGIVAAIFAIPYAVWNGIKRAVEILVVVGSLLLWVATWHVVDLYQLATWPRWQLENRDSMEPHKLLKLALFGFGALLSLGTFAGWAIGHHFNFVEWFPPVLVLGFLYAAATGTRF